MWQYYLTGLLYDLRREASPIAAVRVLQTVLVETVYYLTQYYATLTPSQAHTKRYRLVPAVYTADSAVYTAESSVLNNSL